MPVMTVPVPRQLGHEPPSLRPLPPQARHAFSPVPGVPGGAWSPGLIGWFAA